MTQAESLYETKRVMRSHESVEKMRKAMMDHMKKFWSVKNSADKDDLLSYLEKPLYNTAKVHAEQI